MNTKCRPFCSHACKLLACLKLHHSKNSTVHNVIYVEQHTTYIIYVMCCEVELYLTVYSHSTIICTQKLSYSSIVAQFMSLRVVTAAF